TLNGGRLYGLGAADTKLALACQMTALRSLKDREFKRPLMITGTYGEEMGLVGVERLLRGNQIPQADVLNSEPTQLGIAKGNKGFRIYQVKGKIPGGRRVTGNFYEIYFSGRSAHSATSHLGDNAILKALKWLRKQKGRVCLVDLDGGLAPNIVAPFALLKIILEEGEPQGLKALGAKIQKKKSQVSRKVFPDVYRFLMELLAFLEKKKASHETQNIGTIQLTSGRYEILLDHRVPPQRNPEILNKQLKRALKGSRVKTLKANPAYTQNSNSPLIRQVQGILRAMKKPTAAHVKPGCTEAGFFAQMGSAALTIGPGRAYGNIHQPNEYVGVKDLEEAVEFYRRVIEKMCL
ncbi:MAG: M20/M25/M40 family metallo-hydrolase, partial [bacterium]|nr:M20/M25/M40 family metallo-hydrolase [bacterium]